MARCSFAAARQAAIGGRVSWCQDGRLESHFRFFPASTSSESGSQPFNSAPLSFPTRLGIQSGKPGTTTFVPLPPPTR